MKNILAAVIFVLFAYSGSFGCSLIYSPKSLDSQILKTHYIFIGEVIGITDKKRGEKFLGEAEGMKVKVLTEINLPDASPDYFELFTFGYSDGCYPAGGANFFPIGTKLRIIAKESDYLPVRSTENRVRLQINGNDHLSAVSKKDKFLTDLTSVFDYRNWQTAVRTVLKGDYFRSKEYTRNSIFGFIYMEASKDLIRLNNSPASAGKLEILERLVYCPYIDFPQIVDSNDQQIQDKTRLLDKRKEIEGSDFFNLR